MTLNLGQLNAHNRSGAVAFMLDTNRDALGFNEVQQVLPSLKGRRKYRVHKGRKVGTRNTAQGVATLVKRRHAYLGQMHQQVSQEVPRFSRTAPDRYFLASVFDFHGLPVAHVNIHPNAGPKALMLGDENSRVVREYVRSMVWLEALLVMYREAGVARVLTGDANLPATVDHDWTPYAIMRRTGMTWATHHIDVIGWEKRKFSLERKRIVPKAKTGADHDGLLVNLNVA